MLESDADVGPSQTSSPPAFDIEPVSDDASLAAARILVGDYMRSLFPPRDATAIAAVLTALPAPYLPPAGGLWLAREGADAAAVIALQPHESTIAEIKRMYVRPASRGRGLARALVQHAIAEARARGYHSVRLGTLTTMHSAQRLYESVGFARIPAYRPFEFGDTVYYELTLGSTA